MARLNNLTLAESMRTQALVQSAFCDAAQAWLETRRGHLAPRTFLDYAQYIRTLSNYFGEMRIPEISPDQIRAYQQLRRKTVGSGIINHECMVLLQMRKRIGMPILDYEKLKMPKEWESPGRRLTDEEEAKLEAVCTAAVVNPKWTVAACACLLSMKSGAGPGEIRSLRLKDCSLNPPEIVIPRSGAKNVRRERPAPLNDTAAWALEKLLDRATEVCGCKEPQHYLIPFQNRDHSFNPAKPPSIQCWRTSFRTLLKMAGVKTRFYNFRHHAVSTGLANPNVSIADARRYYGWISDKMERRYYHGSRAGLEAVACAMERKAVQKEYDSRKPLKKRTI